MHLAVKVLLPEKCKICICDFVKVAKFGIDKGGIKSKPLGMLTKIKVKLHMLPWALIIKT